MSQPTFAKLCFIREKPTELWEKCLEELKSWEKQKGECAERMKEFRKKMAFKCVWLANTLEDTLPKGACRELELERAEEVFGLGVKTDEPGFCQLQQHLEAFDSLCGSSNLPQLTEELVKKVHGVMMKGLKNEQGYSVDAGAYRKCSVHAGSLSAGYHIYPSWEWIPDSMAKIVKTYEDKIHSDHDPYALASWLYFSVVSLHPFVDGNGRISRLLWCYSLMRDGLPFPVVLTSGHKKSQKHLLLCLKRDSTQSVASGLPHITALTVVSVHNAWQEYSQYIH